MGRKVRWCGVCICGQFLCANVSGVCMFTRVHMCVCLGVQMGSGCADVFVYVIGMCVCACLHVCTSDGCCVASW